MPSAKVAITMEKQLLRLVDHWVRQGRYPNRSRAVQAAVREKAQLWERTRLAQEVAKLNPKEERSLAEEFSGSESWPEY